MNPPADQTLFKTNSSRLMGKRTRNAQGNRLTCHSNGALNSGLFCPAGSLVKGTVSSGPCLTVAPMRSTWSPSPSPPPLEGEAQRDPDRLGDCRVGVLEP